MNKSEQINELAAALAKFQAGMGNVHKSEMHLQFKKPYATITDVIETVKGPLSELGLSFAQFPDGQALTTILMHTSGQWIESSYQLNPEKGNPQGWGSAITYARRYALTAILGLGTEDDDGQAASTPAEKGKQPMTPVIMQAMKDAWIGKKVTFAQVESKLADQYDATPEQKAEIQQFILNNPQ